MTDVENAILILLLGWLLGTLNPSIIRRIENGDRRKKIRSALKIELKELCHVMAAVVYIIALRFGNYDRALVEWLIPILENYEGENPSENTLHLLKKQQELDDIEFAKFVALGKANTEAGLSVKKYNLPYLELKVGELSLFSEQFQRLVLNVLADLHSFNATVEEAKSYLKLTFEPISEENRAIASENLKTSYQNIEERARIIIERIKKLEKI